MNEEQIICRIAEEEDQDAVMLIEREAFGQEDEANLVADFLNDPSAAPYVSIIAFYDDQPAGHIFFSKANIKEHGSVSAYILAPMAVMPPLQGKGIGKALIAKGEEVLRDLGCDLVFVLGHPEYYPRSDYINDAEKLGYVPPFSIPAKYAEAWMVKKLNQDIKIELPVDVSCCDTLNQEELWSA